MAAVVSAAFGRNPEIMPPDDVIFGRSPTMRALRQKVEKIATANVPVLLEGESGTGKDIIARLIHKLSPWSGGPWVKVNCPAIPGTLLESELFGYERGAFTGAYESKPGRVEHASRGTLFLDEISELEANLQSKLLQVLQDGQFFRIGAQEDRRVEARVVCSTNRKLEHEVETGKFRQDLFYRINVVSVHLPPLRERACDLEHLSNYFLEFYNEKYNCRMHPLSSQTMAAMTSYSWPGNIRELENLIRRYVILGSEEFIASDIARTPRPDLLDLDLVLEGPISLKKLTRQATRQLEHKVILKVLEANNWNRKRTARALGISYRALLYKMSDAKLPGRSSATS